MPEELDMLEAAMLPESDPLRQEWERKIALSAPEVQAQWHKLIAQAQQSCKLFREIGLPEGLRAELLSIPANGELEAASMLPPDDPARLEIESGLLGAPAPSPMSLNGTTSHHTSMNNPQYRELLEQTEHLRTEMFRGSDARMPDALNKRLLSIPQTRRWWQISGPVRWAAAAVAAVLIYYTGTVGVDQYHAFQDRRELNQVASLVVNQHPTPPSTLIQSEDEAAIIETLTRQGMSMPPIIVPYRQPGSHITGGGVTTFNGEKAYFTLWEWKGKQYTLYQFMPSTFHLRENFVEHETTVSKTAATATSPSDFHVWYWSEPDHHCGWAAVATGPNADNLFIMW